MNATQRQARILLLTVGVGNIDQLRQTLLDPLLKSIRDGQWERVILLPSQFTGEMARQAAAEVEGTPIELAPLPAKGDEDDADVCLAHFGGVLDGLLAHGYRPEQLLIDFTRGTKVMSAALVLAAVRRALPRARYVVGGRRDERGVTIAGTEIIRELDLRPFAGGEPSSPS